MCVHINIHRTYRYTHMRGNDVYKCTVCVQVATIAHLLSLDDPRPPCQGGLPHASFKGGLFATEEGTIDFDAYRGRVWHPLRKKHPEEEEGRASGSLLGDGLNCFLYTYTWQERYKEWKGYKVYIHTILYTDAMKQIYNVVVRIHIHFTLVPITQVYKVLGTHCL